MAIHTARIIAERYPRAYDAPGMEFSRGDLQANGREDAYLTGPNGRSRGFGPPLRTPAKPALEPHSNGSRNPSSTRDSCQTLPALARPGQDFGAYLVRRKRRESQLQCQQPLAVQGHHVANVNVVSSNLIGIVAPRRNRAWRYQAVRRRRRRHTAAPMASMAAVAGSGMAEVVRLTTTSPRPSSVAGSPW